MSLDKVEPLVARFLGIKKETMARHFYPAEEEQLRQIADIRQKVISQSITEDEKYLRWRYTFSTTRSSNPLDENRVWVFTRDDEILGMVGMEAVELLVDGAPNKAMKVMDLLVQPQVDRKGLGVWMQLKLQSMGRPVIALGSNENSLGIVSKLFYRMPNQAVYKNVLNSVHYFRHKLGSGPLAKAAALVYDISLSLSLTARLSCAREDVMLRRVERFTVADETALAKMQLDGIQFKRDSNYLNWRLLENPRDKVEITGLYRSNQLIGYIALAFRSRPSYNSDVEQAFLLDWAIRPGKENEKSLATALVRLQYRLKQQRVESIGAFSYHPFSGRLLRQAGLHRRPDDTKTVSIFAEPGVLKRLQRADRWFLTGADTDYA